MVEEKSNEKTCRHFLLHVRGKKASGSLHWLG